MSERPDDPRPAGDAVTSGARVPDPRGEGAGPQPGADGPVPATPARRRGARRAVRHAGTVGTDDTVLRSTLPAQPGPDGPRGSEPTGSAPEPPREPAVPVRSLDDSDVGWGHASDSNDDRLHRDRPPHW